MLVEVVFFLYQPRELLVINAVARKMKGEKEERRKKRKGGCGKGRRNNGTVWRGAKRYAIVSDRHI